MNIYLKSLCNVIIPSFCLRKMRLAASSRESVNMNVGELNIALSLYARAHSCKRSRTAVPISDVEETGRASSP